MNRQQISPESSLRPNDGDVGIRRRDLSAASRLHRRRFLIATIHTITTAMCDEPLLFGIAEQFTALLQSRAKAASERRMLAVGTALAGWIRRRQGYEASCQRSDENQVPVGISSSMPPLPSTFNVLPDPEFRRMFLVGKSQLESLLHSLHHIFHPPDRIVHRCSISPRETLMLTLYMLTSRESYRSVASRFRMNAGNCYYVFTTFCTRLANARDNYVVWPNAAQRSRIKDTVHRDYGLPGVVGVLGICHLPVKQSSYKQRHVCLQATCDHSTRLSSVHCVIDEKNVLNVWNDSPLRHKLHNSTFSAQLDVLAANEHLIGSGNFPLETFLMTPYNERELSAERQRYNSMHAEVYSLFRKTVNVLVQRFQRLQLLDGQIADKILNVVSAACVLHNLVLVSDSSDEHESTVSNVIVHSELQHNANGSSEAALKRDTISCELMNKSYNS